MCAVLKVTGLSSAECCHAQGSTKVALYGLGALREERVVRAFMTPDHVQWYACLAIEVTFADASIKQLCQSHP